MDLASMQAAAMRAECAKLNTDEVELIVFFDEACVSVSTKSDNKDVNDFLHILWEMTYNKGVRVKDIIVTNKNVKGKSICVEAKKKSNQIIDY